ncbi:MAG: inverse autotransporter beta domain-containing protein [Pseudolabrys sp.]
MSRSRRKRQVRRALIVVGAMVIGLVGGAASRAASESPFADRFFFDRGGAFTSTPYLLNSYAGQQTAVDSTANAFAWGKSAVNSYLLPGIGENLPEWAKRIEFEWDVQKDLKPTYQILTVQPLYQDADKQNTFFVQASQLRYSMIDKYRDTTNVGLGYRRLLMGNQVLAGVNAFFDYEWTYGHQRASVGGELKWAMLDFNTNIYRRITDYKTIDASTNTTERVMNGYDLELRSQVPYLPWAQVGARYYRWQSDLAEDTKGWQYSASADITQNLSIEAGWKKDNFNNAEAFAKFVVRLARTDRPVLFSDKAFSRDVFEPRDMRNYTLDKVRRENKIIVERTGGGIVIARGS